MAKAKASPRRAGWELFLLPGVRLQLEQESPGVLEAFQALGQAGPWEPVAVLYVAIANVLRHGSKASPSVVSLLARLGREYAEQFTAPPPKPEAADSSRRNAVLDAIREAYKAPWLLSFKLSKIDPLFEKLSVARVREIVDEYTPGGRGAAAVSVHAVAARLSTGCRAFGDESQKLSARQRESIPRSDGEKIAAQKFKNADHDRRRPARPTKKRTSKTRRKARRDSVI
jgi:hypothetical protein